jgi:hypothetical protein
MEVRLPNENRNPEPIFYLSGLIEALESGPWPTCMVEAKGFQSWVFIFQGIICVTLSL